MTSLIIIDGQHIEEKRFNIIVQSFVIKKQLGEKTQILAVDLGPIAINFKHGYAASPIDLIAGGLAHITLVLQHQYSKYIYNQIHSEMNYDIRNICGKFSQFLCPSRDLYNHN